MQANVPKTSHCIENVEGFLTLVSPISVSITAKGEAERTKARRHNRQTPWQKRLKRFEK
jgi:hypothetical protein